MGRAVPRPSRPGRRTSGVAGLVALCLLVVAASCTGRGPGSARVDPRAIKVASFDFSESVVLGELYAQALEAHGYPVVRFLGLGAREMVQPALAKGLVDLVPEYAGSALQFVTVGAGRPSADPGSTHEALVAALGPHHLTALSPAPAQDANVIVVTPQTAVRYGLTSVSDLQRAAGTLVFGGPPECPHRPFCLAGLKERYGVTFGTFVPLDSGGPLTLAALTAGQIDVALMFSSDPNIRARNLVPLTDDRDLQPAENVTPVARQRVVDRFGPGFAAALDEVSSHLTQLELVSLNATVGLQGRTPRAVAAAWLDEQGLG